MRQYKSIGPARRVAAAMLAIILLLMIPAGVILLREGEWIGGAFALLFGSVFGSAMVFAALTGRSPEHLKDVLYSGGWWPGGS